MLDTARFKYPPHWVDTTQLYDSIKTVDPESGKYRGFMLLSRKGDHTPYPAHKLLEKVKEKRKLKQ